MIDRGYIWRVAFIAVVLLALWGVLVVRLGVLHLGTNATLQERVRRMRTVEEKILVGRGRHSGPQRHICWRWTCRSRTSCVDPVVGVEQRPGQGGERAAGARAPPPAGAGLSTASNRPGRRYEPVARLVREEEAVEGGAAQAARRVLRAHDHPLLSPRADGLPRPGVLQQGRGRQRRPRAAVGSLPEGTAGPPPERTRRPAPRNL